MMIGKHLKQLRKDKNLSMKEASDLIGVKVPTLNGYESNTRKPEFETLIKLADVYNVSLDELVGRKPPINLGYIILIKEWEEQGRTAQDIREYFNKIEQLKSILKDIINL